MPKIETVKLKEVVLGEGRPKICIPLTAKTKEELIVQARIASNSCADLIEWRADLFLENLDRDHLLFVLDIVKKSLGSIPLLFTCRTKKEGGGKNFSPLRRRLYAGKRLGERKRTGTACLWIYAL